MGSTLNQAFSRATGAIESLYRDRATVYVRSKAGNGAFDDATELTTVLEDVAAKISRKIIYPMAKSKSADVNYDAVIYLSTALQIPQGAIIDVTDINGHTQRYYRASSGYMSYKTHQEVAVTYDERK